MSGGFQVSVRGDALLETTAFEVQASDTIFSLKQRLTKAHNIPPPDRQRLAFGKEMLKVRASVCIVPGYVCITTARVRMIMSQDNRTLEEFEVRPSDACQTPATLDLEVD